MLGLGASRPAIVIKWRNKQLGMSLNKYLDQIIEQAPPLLNDV